MSKPFDVAIIGAGAAGMMCTAVAGQRGKRVVLIDHATKLAEKIRISGGGRCNFTNLHASPQNYLSQNPHFCKSALARYTPQDFLHLVKRHHIGFHEKHKGQLFCNDSSEAIIEMLKAECAKGNVTWRMPCEVTSIEKSAEAFRLELKPGEALHAHNVVIASGGLSIPKIGATDFAYRVARQFNISVVKTYPGLVPLSFDSSSWERFAPLSGTSLAVEIETGEKKHHALFAEDLLFTHRGLSGPAVLQISSFWQPSTTLSINLVPHLDIAKYFLEHKKTNKKNLGNSLKQWLPSRLAEGWLQVNGFNPELNPADLLDKQLTRLGETLNAWHILPQSTEGYRKAEVTCGGIDTKELSQQTMAALKVPGLYFIGEAVDVTGWLGGYNFQWAWASGMAAGQAL